MKRFVQSLFTFLLFALFLSPVLAQSPVPEPVTPDILISQDPTFAADGQVTLNEIYGGPVFAAGGQVDFTGTAQQDLVVAGGTIRVSGMVQQDIYAAGGSVVISGQVLGNVIVAGGEVQILPTAQIGGSVIASGERLQIHPYLQQSSWLAGKNIFITRGANKNLTVAGESVRLAPTASIAGDLTVRVEEEGLDDQASVAGQRDIQYGEVDAPEGPLSEISKLLYDFAWRILFLGVLLLVMPSTLKKTGELLKNNLGSTAVSGMIWLAGIPLLVLVLFMTVIGIPLAGFLGLLYLAVVLVSWTFPTIALGERLLPGKNQWLQAGAAVALVTLVGAFPFLGTLLNIVLVVLGTGALWSLAKQSRTVPKASKK